MQSPQSCGRELLRSVQPSPSMMARGHLFSEIKALAEAGASLIWLHEREKRPIGADWSEKPTMTWAQLKKTYRDGYNVGVRLGEPSRMDDGLYLHCIDVDIRDPARAEEAWAKLKELFPGVRV